MQKENDAYINFPSPEMLLGTPEDTPLLVDLFLITAKMHIYFCQFKSTTLNSDGFIRMVNNIKCLEKYISVNTTKHKFTIKNGS